VLPDVFDPPTVRTLLLVALAVVAIAMLLTVRFIGRLAAKLAVLVVLVGVGAGLWAQRNELATCTDTGDCALFGFELEIPEPG
jgi:hypothetical protein